jgi:hypothetical protein
MNKSNRWASVELEENLKVRRYKWEFLRRNPEYQTDYAAFADQFDDWYEEHGTWLPVGFSKETNPSAWAFYWEQIEPAAWKITERWGIRNPEDPADSEPWMLPSILTEDQVRTVGSEQEAEPKESAKWDYFSHILGKVPLTAKGLRFIQAEIDIAQPTAKIFAEVEERVALARARYRHHFGPIAEFRKRPRVRLEEYSSYLRVWDLRKQKLTFEQIAFQLFPREMKILNSRSAMTKRVRSHFQRAQKLIDGEFRQIEG